MMKRILQLCSCLCSRRSSLCSVQTKSTRIIRPQIYSAYANSHWARNPSVSSQSEPPHRCFQPARLLTFDLATEKLLRSVDGDDCMSEPQVSSPSSHLPDTLSNKVVSCDLTCSGCGAVLQATDPTLPGFIPQDKIDEWKTHAESLVEVNMSSCDTDEPPELEKASDTDVAGSKTPLVCQRCFSLKHYNTALNITLKADDYKQHLSQLKDKRALILLMVDVTDFPGSIFPDLHTLLSVNSHVMIVANKIDLFPKTLKASFWNMYKDMIMKECLQSSLNGCTVTGVHFISTKSGEGVSKLAEDVADKWGNRGDVYLLGCTNVGKSSLFNELLVLLCGAKPGQLNTDSRISAPMATISLWPGTTLGLLSFPIMSVGKRRRLMHQIQRIEAEASLSKTSFFEDDNLEKLAFDYNEILTPKEAKDATKRALQDTEVEDVLEEIGISQKKNRLIDKNASPRNRFWLYDTPGAINDAQLINHLTTQELKLALPKKSIKPRTFILKPGQCLFVGGLARLDYESGPVSAYFTVFAASYLPIQVSKIINADQVYSKNIGTQLLKVPTGDTNRIEQFPQFDSRPVYVCGLDWKHSAVDVVLSSAGWVAVTIGHAKEAVLSAYTPLGKGIYVRKPSIFPEEVNKRGRRSRKGNRSSFQGQ